MYPAEWHIFPCTGKLPATPHGFKDAKLAAEWPADSFKNKNVALATGKISGVWVLDIDVKNGAQGAYSLEQLEKEHGKLDTLTARTWSGGLHYYFKYVPGIKTRTGVWPGIDVRSDGGYVIIPPSTIEGKPYSYLDVETIEGIKDTPAWLIKALTEAKQIPKFHLPRDAEGKIPKGKQDDALFKFACSMTAQGFSPEQIKAALMQAILDCPQDKDRPFTDADVKRWMGGAENYDQGKAKVKQAEEQAVKAQERLAKKNDALKKAKERAERISGLERAGLIYNKQWGTLTSCQANVEVLVRLKYPGKFWRNEFSMKDYFYKSEITDAMVNNIHHELEVDQRIVFRREHVNHGVEKLCDSNRKHPLRDELDALKWDNVPRLDRVAVEVFRATNEFADVMVRKWLISAVARIYQPGCKVDHVLTLIGKQGIRKSTAFSILAGRDYFLDDINEIGSKDTLMKFTGRWICEFQELAALQRSQVEQIKAFITRQSDVYRVPFGHREGVSPRTCVFVATTNDDHPLKQEDENRRFWPVYCSMDADVDTDKLSEWRDQIWAEAKAAYMAGESIYIQDQLLLGELKAQQRDLSDTYDPWEDLLKEVLLREWLIMSDAYECLGIEAKHQDYRATERIKRILRRNGFINVKQIGGGEHRGKRPWIRREAANTQPWYGQNWPANAPEVV
jgi:DNA-binding transcriptional MerR regulator